MREFRKSVVRKFKAVNQKTNKHLTSFHALHSSLKMDRLDYTFKFSTELVVVTLTLIVVAVNAFGSVNMASANNLFTKLLAYHPEQNMALYSKTTTVRTVIAQDHSVLIPSASAQVVLASTDAANQQAPADPQSNSIINNNTIQQDNPDSIKQMIADQIKVYVTVDGDTLQSVGNKYGVSKETIAWANNLPTNATLKPGWDLMILPVSGVLHKVTNNDTVGDIARKYKADVQQIISYNGLQDESDIEPGDLLIVPNGVVPPPAPKPAPAVKHVIGGKVVYEPAPGSVTDLSGGRDHIFPWGQCTYYASKKRGGVPWGGNAKNWLANARAYGVKTGSTPVVGAVVVTNESRRYGHVAYVEAVENGRFMVSEMNFEGLGKVDYRWIPTNSSVIKGFIY